MSIAVKPTEPLQIIKPPRAYPTWLATTFTDPNAPVPESVLEENRPKIEPTRILTPGKILGAGPGPRAKIMPPPMVVQQTPMVKVKFRVLSVTDRPIFGFGIRVNDKNLVTNKKGEVALDVYQGHNLEFSTGRESGWVIPNGAERRLRMIGLVPIAQSFPVSTPITVFVYPESGEFQIGRQVFTQRITYTTS